jgi:hypothetical protein
MPTRLKRFSLAALIACLLTILVGVAESYADSADDANRVRGQSDVGATTAKQSATLQNVGAGAVALDTIDHEFVEVIGTDAVDSATTSVITAAAHAAKRGDILRFTSGTYSGLRFHVLSVTTNTITVGMVNAGAWSALDAFQILRHRSPVVDSAGAITTTATVSAFPNEGQQTMANSVSVAVASDQSNLPAVLKPAITGGINKYHAVSAGSTNAANIKATPGQVYGWYIRNRAATDRKVVLHNTTGVPTAGANVYFALDIPAGGAANAFSDIGIAFSGGIGITMVTGAADTDNTAVTANDLIVVIFYN